MFSKAKYNHCISFLTLFHKSCLLDLNPVSRVSFYLLFSRPWRRSVHHVDYYDVTKYQFPHANSSQPAIRDWMRSLFVLCDWLDGIRRHLIATSNTYDIKKLKLSSTSLLSLLGYRIPFH